MTTIDLLLQLSHQERCEMLSALMNDDASAVVERITVRVERIRRAPLAFVSPGHGADEELA